jgi:biopolymer transport protein ExbD
MAKIKMTKKSTATDMTAMCDVAFLLLTFFILTATAKQPDPLSVKTPASTVQTKLPETGLVTITIGKQGGQNRVFFAMKDKDIREKTLELMGNMHQVKFTPEEVASFRIIDEFGVPIGGLKQLIAMKGSDRNKAGVQPGIPLDSLTGGGELKDWIYTARQANVELGKDKELEFAIKGDAAQQYPEIHKIMDILQDQKINNFNLVTGLRPKPKTN